MHLWDFDAVNRQTPLRRLLAISVIAGLLVGPLSRPVLAGALPDDSISAATEEGSVAMEGMAGDMPCCPAKAPAPFECDKCVSMASCISQCFAGVSSAAFRPPVAPSGRIARLQNDSWPEGLGHPPPEYPPRPLV